MLVLHVKYLGERDGDRHVRLRTGSMELPGVGLSCLGNLPGAIGSERGARELLFSVDETVFVGPLGEARWGSLVDLASFWRTSAWVGVRTGTLRYTIFLGVHLVDV